MNIYERAINNGCDYEASCVNISPWKWDELMKGHRKANKKKVIKIALLAGVIDEEQAAQETQRHYYNPYTHYITRTHIIYVNSAIEHFIKVY